MAYRKNGGVVLLNSFSLLDHHAFAANPFQAVGSMLWWSRSGMPFGVHEHLGCRDARITRRRLGTKGASMAVRAVRLCARQGQETSSDYLLRSRIRDHAFSITSTHRNSHTHPAGRLGTNVPALDDRRRPRIFRCVHVHLTR